MQSEEHRLYNRVRSGVNSPRRQQDQLSQPTLRPRFIQRTHSSSTQSSDCSAAESSRDNPSQLQVLDHAAHIAGRLDINIENGCDLPNPRPEDARSRPVLLTSQPPIGRISHTALRQTTHANSSSGATPAVPRSSRPLVKNLVNQFNQGATRVPSLPLNGYSKTRTRRPTSTGSSRSDVSLPLDPSNEAQPAPTGVPPPRRPRDRPVYVGRSSSEKTMRLAEETPDTESHERDSKRTTASQEDRCEFPQRLLFGEVIGDNSNLQLPGFGVPAMGQRRGSEGSLQPSGSALSHRRSYSNIEHPSLDYSTLYASKSSSASASTEGHCRSHSDLTNSPGWYYKHPFVVQSGWPEPAKTRPAAVSHVQYARASPSRIPRPSRRTSSISDSSASRMLPRENPAIDGAIPHSRAYPTEVNNRAVVSPVRANTYHRRDDAVSALGYRRYGNNVKQTGSGQSLKAMIHAPLPKTSPPLRHSKNRQPVSIASTASSRARNRAASSNLSCSPPSPREGPSASSGGSSLLRNAAVQQDELSSNNFIDVHTITGETGEMKRRRERASVSAMVSGGDNSAGSDTVSDQMLSTDSRAGAEALRGESPILGVSDSFVTSAKKASHPGRRPGIKAPNVTGGHATPDGGPAASPPAEARIIDQGTLLDQVLSLRTRSPSNNSQTTFTEDERSAIGGSDLVEISSKRSSSSAQSWSDRLEQHEAETKQVVEDEPGRGSLADHPGRGIEYEHTSEAETPGSRSSQTSHGPAGMEWREASPQDRTYWPTYTLPSNKSAGTDNLTSSDNAYEVLYQALSYYRSAPTITAEKAEELQETVCSVIPTVDHAHWMSKDATEHFLQCLLEGITSHSEVVTKENIKDTVPSTELQRMPDIHALENSPDLEQTGTAIIYAQTQRYSRETHIASPWDSPSREFYEGHSEYRPAPPPKDSSFTALSDEGLVSRSHDTVMTTLPDIRGAGEGLGLSIDVVSETPSALRSAPPFPDHSPPLPPTASMNPADTLSTFYLKHRLPDAPAPNLAYMNSPVGIADGPSMSPRTRSPTNAPADRSAGISLDVDNEQKRLRKRRHVIKELIDTENTFNQDMKVMEDIYKGTSTEIPDIKDEDRKIIFGNSAAVVEFSQSFFDALRQSASSMYILPKEKRWNHKRGSFSTSHSTATDLSYQIGTDKVDPEQDSKTSIGEVFCRYIPDMERVFGDYIKNHDAANQRLVVLQKEERVRIWIQECHSWAKDLTDAWNLDALLVKPTQRILKYPLLLQSLLDCTPDSHPDYAMLKTAKEELIGVSTRINSAKKRAELVERAANRKRKESEVRLNLSKAFGRRTEKLKQQVGLADSVDDQEYDAIAQKFGGHFFQLQIVMRDVEKYLDDVQGQFDQMNGWVSATTAVIDVGPSSVPEIESKWRRYAQVMGEITSVALPEHKSKVRKSVIEPIMTFWKLHDQPQKMMQKRKKKIVDYAKFKASQERGEKPDKKLQEQAEQFEAINETLKIELPKLYALTRNLVEACLASFTKIQMDWQSTLMRKMQSVIERPRLGGAFNQDLAAIQQEFTGDYGIVEAQVVSLSICNNSLITEASNFLSPTATLTDDSNSFRRPNTLVGSRRTQSITSEQSATSPTLDSSQRNSGNYPFLNFDSTSPLDAPSQAPPFGRMRAGSGVSSRAPSTPRSLSTTGAGAGGIPQRPSTATGRTMEPSQNMPRLSLEMEQRAGAPLIPISSPSYHRSSSIFSSAMPMSDSSDVIRSASPDLRLQEEPEVLFLAASLFEFNIANDRREGGIPYLVYVPGEIFDVIGQKGELWLARNQDDPQKRVGWIWEKHFARILSDEP